MPRIKSEKQLILQMTQVGIIQRFWTNLRKVGKKNLTRNYLTAQLELLENHWSQVIRNHNTLYVLENIVDTEYMKQNIFSEVESQYVMTKTKINDLLKGKPSAESASNKTCCHNEYRLMDMPKIMLPKFDGNLNDWEDFRDIFIAVVHDDKTIPFIKKMHCLVVSSTKQSRLSVRYSEVLKVMNRHGHSLLNILIIRNDDWKVMYTVFSSHSLKHQRKISMH